MRRTPYIHKSITQNMRDLFALISVFILSLSAMPIGSSFAQMTPSYSESNNTHQIASPDQPTVMHPSEEIIDTINQMMNYGNVQISNSSQGNISGSIETTTAGGFIYTTWVGKTNDTQDHVFLVIANENGESFSNPVELTSEELGNATNFLNVTNLDICALEDTIAAAWQENSTTGESRVVGSISYNGGDTFTTSQISDGNVNARDPIFPPGACLIVLYVAEVGGNEVIYLWRW